MKMAGGLTRDVDGLNRCRFTQAGKLVKQKFKIYKDGFDTCRLRGGELMYADT